MADLATVLMGAAGAAGGDKLYVEDVFSTYLYTGTGAAQTITNGIDLDGEGGLVWIKSRSAATNHFLFDTERGVTDEINSNTTDAEASLANSLTAFNSDGFSISSASGIGVSAATYASWTFRKAEKFFDVVTYTGNGVAGRTVAHNLGSTPGCIIVKATSAANDWLVYHTSLGNTKGMSISSTSAAATSTTYWNNTSPTSTQFTVGTSPRSNENGTTFVAYLFAHDAGGFGLTGTDNVITCGSFTTDGSENSTTNLGYEPQWLLLKASSGATSASQPWRIFDNMRGLTVAGQDDASLQPNNSNAESQVNRIGITSTGFTTNAFGANETFIYIAIRRGPMKTPTSGTSVFVPTVYTGTNVDNRLLDTTIAPDMVWIRQRDDTVLGGMVVGDRLRGQPYLLTGTTAAEVDDADAFDKQLVSTTEYGTAFSSMNGVWIGNDATAKLNVNTTSNNHIVEAFKRAPGFFDVVCYTGNGSATTVAHNLGVAPELMIVKGRSAASGWIVYYSGWQDGRRLILQGNNALISALSSIWNDTAPTSTNFTVGTALSTSTVTYINYLFASCPGVSKVGSYTGNGSSVTVTTGFQPRFIMVKRTDSTGNWIVGDSARGLVSADEPALFLNSTAAETTGQDWVDVLSTGFTVNETALNANVNTATYIYLCVA